MSDDTNAELLGLVKALTERVEGLELEIKGLRLHAQEVPEEVIVAIAAAVAGYLGFRAKKRVAHFEGSEAWKVTTRRSQHIHAPLHLR